MSEALSVKKPAPSAETVAAMARALKLPMQELLDLQRAAAEENTDTRGGPGKPIDQWDPHDLEVHPAGPLRGASGSHSPAVEALPWYVWREHDRVLADAVHEAAAGHSRMVILVGTSSTGKTRACWEAVLPLAKKEWRLWHPFDPTRAEAALEDLYRVEPRTVVWLNEAQHYFGNPTVGERIAAAVHHLLVSPERGPVLVLGTLWPEYAHEYAKRPDPLSEDPHSRVRELLSGRTVTVPDTFNTSALAAASAYAEAGDRLLGDALTRTRDGGRVTQDLAGAPELLNRYEQASPAAKALLEAAMDARRLGVGLHLPHAFLTHATPDYLTATDYDQLADDWAELAFAELAALVHGKQAPLRRTTPRPPRRPPAPSDGCDTSLPATVVPVFRLADYLEQHGRTNRRGLCPPASFWHAAYTYLTNPDELGTLADEAQSRHRLQWARHLRVRAADRGNLRELCRLAELQEEAGDREGAERLYRAAAESRFPHALSELARMRQEAGDGEEAERLARAAADLGDTFVLERLASLWKEAGNLEGAGRLYRAAAGSGSPFALSGLVRMWEEAGDREEAERVARAAARSGEGNVLGCLAQMRQEAGDREGAGVLALEALEYDDLPLWNLLCHLDWVEEREIVESLLRQAIANGYTHSVLSDLAVLREQAGDREEAQALALRALDRGETIGLGRLAEMREEAGDREDAQAFALQAFDHGNWSCLTQLQTMRETAGDPRGVESLLRQALAHGYTYALDDLALLREQAGDREEAQAFALQALDRGDTDALLRLAEMREGAGDREGAQALALQAASRGNTKVLYRLAVMREEAGDREGAETLARQAAHLGDTGTLSRLAEMREKAGDREGAQALVLQAIAQGDELCVYQLECVRDAAGDREGAESFLRWAAEHGSIAALKSLYVKRFAAGDREGAEFFLRQAASHGSIYALTHLAWMREEAGDLEEAESLLRQAADLGSKDALCRLGMLRKEAGDLEEAESLLRQAADLESKDALCRLGMLRKEAGDLEEAESLLRQAASRGSDDALCQLAVLRKEAGDLEEAESLLRQAADRGYNRALHKLADRREEVGDRAGARLLAWQATNRSSFPFHRGRPPIQRVRSILSMLEEWERASSQEDADFLLRQAADKGNINALCQLARKQEQAGDRESAKLLLRQVADHGTIGQSGIQELLSSLWPHGLDPDGTPTPSWQPSTPISRQEP
ncbi:transcriptional regulator [Streptomyces canus]|uniref:transcriptional regulator n=1 Tax=Streptomyces canus TaxID=58343 RepID=UPI0033A38EE5